MSAGYVEFPFEDDDDRLLQDALDRLAATFPGWVPREGHLEVALLEEFARMAGETRRVAAHVPDAIFRAYGTKIVGIVPVAGTRATVASTWTMVDAAGYTIPAGVRVGYPVAGDELILFETLAAVTVAPGQTATAPGGVTLVAVGDGTHANDLPAATVTLVDSLSYVTSIATTDTTAGGVDSETDAAYLDRLSQELTLLTPRPILPGDFAVLARRVPGVARALAVDGHDPGVDEQQTVEVTDATGGTFTLTFSAQTTAAIAYNATAADVQAALEALSNVDPGDVVVTGGPVNVAGGVTVEFTGQYASTDVAQMTADGTGLTGAGAAVTVTTTVPGVAPSSNNERMVSVAAVDTGGKTLPQATRDQLDADLQAERETNFVVHVIDPAYTAVLVDFAAVALPGYDPGEVTAAAQQAVKDHIDPAYWGGGDATPPVWDAATTVRYLEVAAVIDRVDGVDYVTSLTINGAAADLPLTGVAPLPAPFDATAPSVVTGNVAAP